MPIKSDRKIIQVGGSKVVALPPGWLSAYNLRLGDTVELFADSLLFIKPKALTIDSQLIRRELRLLAETRSR
ncbi:MAG TPA: hypothetical protein VN739_03070 [Nitrososphaerales archaeon]|nr:hypothetical protein [Nitrososphaerales archaeon]